MTGALWPWSEMVAALAAFFASHIIPARPPVRRWLRTHLGGLVYMALYSALSLAILAWLVIAANRAPYVEIWPFAPWQLWVPNIVMPVACLLIAFGVAAPNPFSIAGRRVERFDPDRPGVTAATRHPLIWGLTLWAVAHLVPNGDLAHVILFGLFALFGLMGMVTLDRRRQREWGGEEWRRRSARTSFLLFTALISGKTKLTELPADWRRILAAAALYLALLLSHRALIGVSPLPVI
jgi:uncharacterized membrane protein